MFGRCSRRLREARAQRTRRAPTRRPRTAHAPPTHRPRTAHAPPTRRPRASRTPPTHRPHAARPLPTQRVAALAGARRAGSCLARRRVRAIPCWMLHDRSCVPKPSQAINASTAAVGCPCAPASLLAACPIRSSLAALSPRLRRHPLPGLLCGGDAVGCVRLPVSFLAGVAIAPPPHPHAAQPTDPLYAITRTPPFPSATTTRPAMPTNSPWSTTPGTASSVRSNAAGSGIPGYLQSNT